MWGVRDVHVTFGRAHALRGVTLDVASGSVCCVVGPDGAGKTTLLRLVAGAIEPDRGAVSRPPRERVGYVSERSSAYPDLTVDENLAFAARAYGVRTDDGRVSELVERIGLADARGRLASALSGGMRQKLAVAMALVHRPDLLVLDEPTTGVDPVSRADVWRLIASAAAAGTAVVASTTYSDEAERAATVLVLEDGAPLLSGAPERLVASIPGWIIEVDHRPARLRSWRRGRRWRAWAPPGSRVPKGSRVEADLEDAVVVASHA